MLRGYLPSHSSIPRGFLCMLGLVSCIELFVALNGRHFKTDIATSWSATSHDAIHEAKECEVLCFGDSLVKFGVLPRVVEAWSGRRTFNLALLNGPPSASYYLLRRALWAGARPKAVVIDIMPHQLARGPRHEEFARAWPELLSIPDCLDLAWASRDPDLLASTIMATLFPSIRARREIRACIHAAMVGRSASFKDQARALRANWTAHRGGQVASRGPQAMPSFEWPDDAPLSRPWASDRVSVGYVERFLELARSRGITVVWLLPPITRASPVRRELLDTSYTRFVALMQSRYSNLLVADARKARYDPTRFVDPVHLHRSGATTLSADVASLLTRPPASAKATSHWVALPDERNIGRDAVLFLLSLEERAGKRE